MLLSNFEEHIYATFQSIQVPLSEHQLSLESEIMAIICLLLICGFVGKYKRYLNWIQELKIVQISVSLNKE